MAGKRLHVDIAVFCPAQYGDRHDSLPPGVSREVEIEYPASAAKGEPQVNLRGWKLTPTVVSITQTT
jgi:hypothetical protein